MELLLRNPWLIPASLGLLIPICGIIFGTITRYLQKTRQAELDAALKQQMIHTNPKRQRGGLADASGSCFFGP